MGKHSAMKYRDQVLVFILIILWSHAALAASSSIDSRLSEVEEAIEHIQAELEVIQSQSRMVINQTQLSLLNRFYLKAGLTIILPRQRTFGLTGGQLDTGLGAFLGFGQYFGKHNVGDLAFEWDIYPSITVRYRFELHWDAPKLTFGPVMGYKIRIASSGPWDNFIDSAQSLKNSYTFLGVTFGFPITRSILSLEFLYLFNEQTFLVANTGFHLFF